MPVLVEEMGVLFRKLRDQGVTLLLVGQNVEWALRLARSARSSWIRGRRSSEARSAALLAEQGNSRNVIARFASAYARKQVISCR